MKKFGTLALVAIAALSVSAISGCDKKPADKPAVKPAGSTDKPADKPADKK